jgi:hypothetical protein
VAIKKFKNSLRAEMPGIEKMSSVELEFGNSYLKTAQFLADHWGEWRYESKEEPVHFSNEDNRAEYQRLCAEVKSNRTLILEFVKKRDLTDSSKPGQTFPAQRQRP